MQTLKEKWKIRNPTCRRRAILCGFTGTQAAASDSESTTISLPQINNISQAFTEIQTIIEQTGTLREDLQALKQQLSAQQTQLQAGISTLNNGVNQLTPNAITAFNGYNSVRLRTINCWRAQQA